MTEAPDIFAVEITEFKLSWEMPDPHWAYLICGEAEAFDFAPIWDSIPWRTHPTVKIVPSFEDIRDQYATLRMWEDTKTQPIRNVKLEVRAYIPSPWQPFTPIDSSR